ncbi:MAG: hypothetical protein JSW73_03315 [Candidatus Woesearchaeota archaeon]|nr:MAG: hypothetical protein JSW73_03315 [Candidatus Woesearchaeota archaeon]
MGIFDGEKEPKKAFLDLDMKEEELIKEIEKEADREIQELLETIRLIKDVKNRGLYILEKMNDLDSVLKGEAKTSKLEFNRREYIAGTLEILDRQLEKLKTEELVALQEEKEEDKLEKFILSLTKKADKILGDAKKELESK